MSVCFCFLALIAMVALSGVIGVNPCQDLDSPDCPYNYNNTMADYKPGTPVEISPSLKKFMEQQLSIYLQEIASKFPPSHFDTSTVFAGVGGRALLYLRLWLKSGDAEDLATADAYIQSALKTEHISKVPDEYSGFLWGKTGVWCVGAVIAEKQGDKNTASQLVTKVRIHLNAQHSLSP